MWIRDYHPTAKNDEAKPMFEQTQPLFPSPSDLSKEMHTFSFDGRAGDVHAVFTIEVALMASHELNCHWVAQLVFSGVEDQQEGSFVVPKNGSSEWSGMTLHNGAFENWDACAMNWQVYNDPGTA
jgi:hypothetical protein